jgi:hypothetical protein
MSLTKSETCRVKNPADPDVPALTRFTVSQINPFQLLDFTRGSEIRRFPLIQGTQLALDYWSQQVAWAANKHIRKSQ